MPDLVLSHSEEVKAFASIGGHLSSDEKRCCQQRVYICRPVFVLVEVDVAAKVACGTKLLFFFLVNWVVTKLVGEISVCERVPGTVKRIAGKIVSCGASFITCLRVGIAQTRLLCQLHGSRQPGRT